MLSIVEDPENGPGRLVAINAIRSYVREMKDRPEEDTQVFHETLKRLALLARDPKTPLEGRGLLVCTLYEYADPNEWLDAAIEYSDAQPTAVQKGETFRFFTPKKPLCVSLPRKTQETLNRASFRHELLEKMDDGNGTGYFLAMHLGGIVGIKPVGRENSAFTPDRSLPKYQDGHGLAPAYFQETVDNARAWWAEHKSEYQDVPQ